jgi:kynurenine formamidase
VKKRSLAIVMITVALACYGGSDVHRTTKEDVDRLMTELSNWGRWGKDDQIGAIHLLTNQTRKAAAGLVQTGVSVSIGRRAEKEIAADNPSPFHLNMLSLPASSPYNADGYAVEYHGYGHTHMDALCHIFYKGKMYNGVPESTVTSKGSPKLSVYGMHNGIFARAILIDIPELKGLPYLEAGTPIFPEDLEAWERHAGVHIQSGDVILLRTGRWALREKKGAWDVGKKTAGLHVSCMRWLKQRDVSIIGSDAASDVIPSLVDGVEQPVHQLSIIAMGTPILDNCDLEEVSKMAKQQRRWQVLLTIAPLAVEGGTGSPVNPFVTF